MAKSGKISSALQTMFGDADCRRPFGNRPPRRYYLVVCEGEKTEPNYFESIRKKLPDEMMNRITISGVGKGTHSLVEQAVKEVRQRKKSGMPPYYKIWVVLDRDSFEDFDGAIAEIQQKSTEHEKWHAAWSNEAFELWYIFHFTAQTGGALSRQAYQEMLTRYLGRIYRKNDRDMFELLRPYVVKAIRNAETALRLQVGRPFYEQNPATTVHHLVKELLSYIP